ncbi:B12-binding domain-containing radical SAM protein [Elusimicrobiota bacterium]
MINITFVYPNFESLGVEYLMAICKKNGHGVSFIYYDAEDAYLDKKKQFSSNSIVEDIIKTRPHVVCFSCVTDNYRYQINIAKSLKKNYPKFITIFGGVHPTALPGKVLSNKEVDCVAIGEAEISLIEFLNNCQCHDNLSLPSNAVKGIVFKKKGKIIGNLEMGDHYANLDELPYADKELFTSQAKDRSYLYKVITSRGCPYKCSYCFNSFYWSSGGKSILRQRSVTNVLGELKEAKAKIGLKYVLFLDDCFTTNTSWLLDFCRRYKNEINVPFSCTTNPQYIDSAKAKALSEAGCVNIQIGIQSLSEDLCNNILHRKSDNSKIVTVIKDLKDANIMVQVDHMLGIPEDTIKQQEKSVIFYNKHRPSIISIFWLTYYPKTTILDHALSKGILQESEIAIIEDGRRIGNESYLAGGDMKNPGRYYSLAFIMGWLPLLPKFFVNFLIYSRLYQVFRIKNYYLAIALPRAIYATFNRKDIKGREHIFHFIQQLNMLPRPWRTAVQKILSAL